jgi:hypothetical protein
MDLCPLRGRHRRQNLFQARVPSHDLCGRSRISKQRLRDLVAVKPQLTDLPNPMLRNINRRRVPMEKPNYLRKLVQMGLPFRYRSGGHVRYPEIEQHKLRDIRTENLVW